MTSLFCVHRPAGIYTIRRVNWSQFCGLFHGVLGICWLKAPFGNHNCTIHVDYHMMPIFVNYLFGEGYRFRKEAQIYKHVVSETNIWRNRWFSLWSTFSQSASDILHPCSPWQKKYIIHKYVLTYIVRINFVSSDLNSWLFILGHSLDVKFDGETKQDGTVKANHNTH